MRRDGTIPRCHRCHQAPCRRQTIWPLFSAAMWKQSILITRVSDNMTASTASPKLCPLSHQLLAQVSMTPPATVAGGASCTSPVCWTFLPARWSSATSMATSSRCAASSLNLATRRSSDTSFSETLLTGGSS